MSGFLGSYRHSLDGKGRVSLPAPFRHGSDSDGFVMIQVHPDALSLYPDESWSGVEERLREMVKRRPDARHFLLDMTAHAHSTTPDKQGRILIPDHLRKSSELEDEVLIVGALDKIEIWDPESFEQSTAGVQDDFDQLAASIFA